MRHLKLFFVFVFFVFISVSVVFAADDGGDVSGVGGSADNLSVSGGDYFVEHSGISGSSVSVDGGVYSVYGLNVSDSSVVGGGVDSTFFDMSGSGQGQGICTYGDVSFCNLTIFGSGCGVFRNYGNLSLSNVRFVNHSGGSYFADGCICNSGNLSVFGCEFSNISYYRSSVFYDDNSDDHSVVVDGCIFSGVDAGYRDAVGYIRGADFSLTNCSIVDCGSDGLLSLFCVESCIVNFDCNFVYGNVVNRSLFYACDSVLSFRNSVFAQNRASGFAAGISVCNSDCNIYGVRFRGNYAYGSGSCLYSLNSNVTVNGSVFDGNSACTGSCIAVMNGTCSDSGRVIVPSGISVLGSTFKNNVASGCAVIYDEFTDITVKYSDFVNNTAAGYAGVLYVDFADVNIIGSNFTQNNAGTAGCIYGYNCVITQKNNIYRKNKAVEASDLYIPYTRKFTDQNTTYTGSNSVVKQLTVPVSTDNNYYVESEINMSLPSYFNLADLGYMTPVREQKTGGNCWAFASLAALESCLKMATGKTVDLSENNMKNVMSLYSRYGWYRAANDGGYDNMAMAYLLNWYGPVLEKDDMYNHEDVLSMVRENIIQVNNIYAVPVRANFTDNNKIKEAIMKYGAVITNIYTSYTYRGYNLFNNQTDKVSHAVVIAGWDDNYSRENFGQKPEGDGAFIIKNSWGANAGNNGYYYVSYYDTTILNSIDDMKNTGGYTYILDNHRYNKIYQHDHSGLSSWYDVDNDVRYACEYTITGNETVKAFGTYIYDITAKTSYTAKIYINGELKNTQKGKFRQQYIYQTIQLEKPVSLKKGDTIKIELELTSDKPILVPIQTDTYSNLIQTKQATIKGHTYKDAIPILKIYTQDTDKTKNTQIITRQETQNTIEVIILDQNTNRQNTGTLTIKNMDNKTIDTITVTGKTTTINPAKYNTKQITIKYTNNNLNPSQITINTTITQKLDITPIKTTQNTQIGKNTTITHTFTDTNGNRVKGKTKTAIKINGKTIQNLNITDGKLNTTIPTDKQTSKNYKITIILGENNEYNKQENTITLTITKKPIRPLTDTRTGKIGQKTTLNYTYHDIYGKQLTGTNKAAIKINGKTYMNLNITDGKLNTQLDTSTLNTGKHKITIIIGENTNYTKTENTIILTQQKQKIKQITGQITTNYKQNIKLNHTLTDIHGNPIQGTNKIAIKINGKTQQTLTIKNGKLLTTIPADKLGTKEYTITIITGESSNYEKSESNITLKINKQTIKTNNTPITTQKGKNTTINMEFKDINSKKITGTNKVSVKINGKTYKNLNMTDGVLKTTIPTDKLKTGKYNMTIILGENTNYKKSENNITLTVKN